MKNIEDVIKDIAQEKLEYVDSFEKDGVVYGRGPFRLEWIESLIGQPKIIFDVGCYDCGDSIRFKSFENCEVYAFEASRARHGKLEETCHKYDINLVKKAVGDVDGERIFYDSLVDNIRVDAQGSFFKHTKTYKNKHSRIIQKEEGYVVPVTTIKTFCVQNDISEIDLLHVDVEGAESLVVSGLGDVRPKLIFIETLDCKHGGSMWEGATNSDIVEKQLFDIGYILVKTLSADKLYMDKTLKEIK